MHKLVIIPAIRAILAVKKSMCFYYSYLCLTWEEKLEGS